MMQIIPVIDLLNGAVVHAKRGLRANYAPIQSTLTPSCQPLAVASALLELYPFNILYIADIDAIQGAGDHQNIIAEIAEAFPKISIWLDCGIRQVNARALYWGGNIKPVLGSENIANLQDYRAISYACASKHALSLDYTATTVLGINELHNQARFWPDDTICMTLNSVGNAQGPDISRLQTLMQLNATRKNPSRLYAAGGVRGLSDCVTLKNLKISGVLAATALHDGSMQYADIAQLNE